MLSPGWKRCEVIWWLEPITSATAIVSPSARPRPSITAPTRPLRARGNTRHAEHLPARRAHRERGVLVVLRDGREHLAADRGDDRDHHHREHDAGGHEARAARRPAEHAAEDRAACRSVSATCLYTVLRGVLEHGQRPQPVHDRGDRGEQVDEVDDRLAQPARRELVGEQRDAEAERHRDHERDRRRRPPCRR